jgi:acyl-CoA thioesterase-1
MRLGFRWIVVALALTACARGERNDARDHTSGNAAVQDATPTDRAAASAGRRTILFMGTSLTAGYGLPDPDEAYPALIQQRIDSLGLNYDVINAGVSGETSAGALKRINWIMREPVDVFVLETGANDGLRGLNPDSLRSNIQRIFDSVRAAHPDTRLVLAGMEAPPNLGPRYTSAVREIYPELARKYGATLIPFLLEGVAGVDSLNQPDGIHPNVRGEKVVAENVWKVVGPMVEGERP